MVVSCNSILDTCGKMDILWIDMDFLVLNCSSIQELYLLQINLSSTNEYVVVKLVTFW